MLAGNHFPSGNQIFPLEYLYGLDFKMNNEGRAKCFLFSTIFVSILIHSNHGLANSAGFEIEEIITAIKQDIQTARIAGAGSPNFEIESVNAVLTVLSSVTHKGSLVIKVAGVEQQAQVQTLDRGSYHKLSFTFSPSGTPSFSPESSFGLVEPINIIKSSMRKAYNNPPSANLDTFTIFFQFAIEKSGDGGLSFNIIDVNDLKAQSISTHSVTIYMKLGK